MSKRRDEVAQLFDKTPSEQQVTDEPAAGTMRLLTIKAAKQELAGVYAVALHWAVAHRIAAVEVWA